MNKTPQRDCSSSALATKRCSRTRRHLHPTDPSRSNHHNVDTEATEPSRLAPLIVTATHYSPNAPTQQQRPPFEGSNGSNNSGGCTRNLPAGVATDRVDRVLTAEEEDVEAVKQQIRFTKQESVSSTRNALRIAA
jgi:hypothetical protein